VGKIPRLSGGDIEVKWWGKFQGQVVRISRSSGGENSKAKWWGYRGQLVGELQGQVVGISRSSGGENYQGQVVGISRSSSGDIEVKWWGYQGQGEGLRGQGQKKVVGGACPLQLPLLMSSQIVAAYSVSAGLLFASNSLPTVSIIMLGTGSNLTSVVN
jgi:DNA-directed RNA polymerase subunit H (RpoH/RPB5)